MKTPFVTILTLAAGIALGADTVQTPQAAPVPAAEAPAAENVDAAEIIEDGTDEIDLEEDDSAVAARKPQIKGEVADGDTMSLVDIECDDAMLADVLRQFRKATGANIITGDSSNLTQRVSVSLRRVPWLQGLQSILNSRGFRLDERENIFRVVEDLQTIPISTRAFQLKHASAKELSDLFNKSYGLKDPAGKIIRPIATSFDRANVVVVTADEKVISDCEAIIKAVDKATAQIYIEARFMELSTEAKHKLGMQWDSLESWGVSAKNLSAGWEYNKGKAGNYGSFMTKRTETQQEFPKKETEVIGLVPNKIVAAPGAGRSAENMSWRQARGFSGQLSADDFRLAMSAFEQLNDGKVFSNPKIIVSNGKEAKVDMTTKYPNVTIDSNFTGQNSQNLSVSTKLDTIPGEDKFMFAKEAFFSWGIMLTVKPRISPDGLISVEIVPTISDCTGYAEVSSNKDSNTPYTKYPIIEIKRLTTEFTMKDGSTAVIGGLSKTVEEDIDNGIPYLRKIPWIGPKLFGWKSRGKVQKEIIVCVTVGIANPSELPNDIGLPTNAILGREYVSGVRKEPGFRGGSVNALKLDLRTLGEQNQETQGSEDTRQNAELRKGEVRITPAETKKSLLSELAEEPR